MQWLQNFQKAYFGTVAQYHFFRLIKDPMNTPAIFQLNETVTKAAGQDMIDQIVAGIFEDDGLKKAWEEKYWPNVPSLEELHHFPAGSFGKAAAEFFVKFHLDPDLFPRLEFSTPEEYITARIYQAHDFWHILTGYETNVPDELALQAFGLGQYKLPFSVSIITGGLMHLLKRDPVQTPVVIQKLFEGYQRGLKAKRFLSSPVLERLKDPLEMVRQDLEIEPLPA